MDRGGAPALRLVFAPRRRASGGELRRVPATESTVIEVTERDDIAVLALAHGKANAMDVELLEALTARLQDLAETARAVILTGRGAMFSAGLDLVRITEGGPAYIAQLLGALDGFCRTLFMLPRPVVAAVQGHAIAGGCVAACAADRVLMAEGGGRIGVPEHSVGVPFPPAPVEILRSALPRQVIAEVLYFGNLYTARDAVARGFVHEAVAAEQLIDRAIAEVGRFASTGAAFGVTKRLLRQPAVDRMDASAAAHEAALSAVWTAPETMETLRAYVARTLQRKPAVARAAESG